MKKTVILLVLSLVTISAVHAEAYFRSNTSAAEESRLRDKQARLERQMSSTSQSAEKAKLQNDVEEIISEVKRIEEKKQPTASNK